MTITLAQFDKKTGIGLRSGINITRLRSIVLAESISSTIMYTTVLATTMKKLEYYAFDELQNNLEHLGVKKDLKRRDGMLAALKKYHREETESYLNASAIPKLQVREASKMLLILQESRDAKGLMRLSRFGPEDEMDIAAHKKLLELSGNLFARAKKEGFFSKTVSDIRVNASIVNHLSKLYELITNHKLEDYLKYFEERIRPRKTKAAIKLADDGELKHLVDFILPTIIREQGKN